MNHRTALMFDPWSSSQGTARFAQSIVDGIPLTRPEISAPTMNRDASWIKPTRERINVLARLREDNWDGRGSAAVRTDILVFVWAVLGQVMPYDGKAPGIVPLGHGGVQIEWKGPTREIEIEIVRPHEIAGTVFNIQNGSEQDFHADEVRLDALTAIIWQNIPRI